MVSDAPAVSRPSLLTLLPRSALTSSEKARWAARAPPLLGGRSVPATAIPAQLPPAVSIDSIAISGLIAAAALDAEDIGGADSTPNS